MCACVYTCVCICMTVCMCVIVYLLLHYGYPLGTIFYKLFFKELSNQYMANIFLILHRKTLEK
jgi:hypothetical protein